MKKEPEKMDLKSMNITEEQKKKLKSLFPEVFNEEEIDWERLQQTLGENIDVENKHYELTWPGKSDCFKVIQEESIGTLKPCREESVNFDNTENLFIEGDNLEVLKLLQKSYYNKVKMIYIDPPYNTGKEFIYPDRYQENLDTYLKYTGQKNDEGLKFSTNQETDGRFHSKWLNMMYPRLFLAKNLLRDDGLIFISISDHEKGNLRLLCDEIYGIHNFLGCIIWNSTKSVTNTALISVAHTYNLIYAKNLDYYKGNRQHFRLIEDGSGFSNPDNDPRGPWKADPFQVGGWRPNQQYQIKNPTTNEVYIPNAGSSWKNDEERFKELLSDNRIVFGASGESGPQRKRFLSEAKERGKVSKTWWDDVETTTNGTERVKKLFDNKKVFSNPKPVSLIKKMIQLGDYTGEGIILDFFAGSSTIAPSVFELNKNPDSNRKFIAVQLPEPIDVDDKDQIDAIDFCRDNNIPLDIASLSKERILREIKKAEKDNIDCKANLGFRVFKLDRSNFKVWEGSASKDVEKQLSMHLDSFLLDDSKEEDILYEILIKSGYEPTVRIDKKALANKTVYSVSDDALLICLDKKLTKEVILEMAKLKPSRCVCLDEGFYDNDQLKTNAVETMRSYKVTDFKTV